MIIHFNGMPGVGKKTISEILAKKINARLIDNHLLIDLVVAICDRGSKEYLAMLKKIMNVVLEQTAENPNQIFIFTNALAAESEGDKERFNQIKSFAQNRKIPFVQILITCDLEENKRRIVSENRQLKGKLMDADELEKLWKYTIYHPSNELAFEINTTNLSPETSAGKIKDYLDSIK